MLQDTARRGPGRDFPSQLLAVATLLLSLPIMLAAIGIPRQLQAGWCPQSTFQHGTSSTLTVYGLLIGLPGLILLPIGLLRRFRAFENQDGYSPAQQTEVTIGNRVIFTSSVALLIGGLLWIDGTASYFCATPDEILIRSDYFDTLHRATWDDVTVVDALCTTSRRGRGGSVRLALHDGERVEISLADGGDVRQSTYERIRRSLNGKHYTYDVSKTVTPDQCPPELYPLLRNWAH